MFFTEANIDTIRIDFIDSYLSNFWISCLFTTFCLIIMLNGTNFIDGLNGLIILYFLVIIFILYRLNFINLFVTDTNLLLIIVTLISLLILNFNNKLFMEDSGSYLLGFISGYFLIITYLKNPLFLHILLFYYCGIQHLKIYFQLLEKLKTRKSPIKPDTNHLHHLLFLY